MEELELALVAYVLNPAYLNTTMWHCGSWLQPDLWSSSLWNSSCLGRPSLLIFFFEHVKCSRSHMQLILGSHTIIYMQCLRLKFAWSPIPVIIPYSLPHIQRVMTRAAAHFKQQETHPNQALLSSRCPGSRRLTDGPWRRSSSRQQLVTQLCRLVIPRCSRSTVILSFRPVRDGFTGIKLSF